jgi:hypothetical protein
MATYTYTVDRKHCLPLGYHSAPPRAQKAMRDAAHVAVATFTSKPKALQYADAQHVATGLFHGVAVYMNGRLVGGARTEVRTKDLCSAHKARRMAGKGI